MEEGHPLQEPWRVHPYHPLIEGMEGDGTTILFYGRPYVLIQHTFDLLYQL